MQMQMARKWVAAGFAVLAVAMLTLLAVQIYRSTRTDGLQGDRQRIEDVASLKELAAALKDPSQREAAVKSLREKQGDATVELLAALGHKNPDPEVRAAALSAIGELGDLRGLQVLTIGVRDNDVPVRIAAIRALGLITNDTACAAIAGGLTDIDASVRMTAAETLAAGKGSSVTVEPLCKALTEEEDAKVRCAVALAMGKLEDEDARQALVAALANEHIAEVRKAALTALDAVDDEYRVKGVACAIGDVDEKVRGDAREIFGEIGVEALPALVEALESKELLSVIRSRGGEAVHADILRVVAAMESPETAETLVRLLDLAVGDPEHKAEPRTVIRDGAMDALAALGAGSVASIAAGALHSQVRLPMKKACAEVLAAIGEPAVAALTEYVKSRAALPSSEEAAVWIETLGSIGGPKAEGGIKEVRRRDPDAVFKRLAAATPAPGEWTRPAAPQLEEFNLVLYESLYGGNPPSAYKRRKSNLPFVSGARKGPAKIRAYVPKAGRRPNLVLELCRTENGWERAFGWSLGFNNGITFAKVKRAVVTDESMDLELSIVVGRDPYLLGGYGEYVLSLRRTEEGSYRGPFRGRYRGIDIEGTAVCTRNPKRGPLRAGFTPVRPHEHPYMLFRKVDLPGLRAKLNTPLGKAAFRRMASAATGYSGAGHITDRHVALGVLYQLTGDSRYAQEAVPVMKHQMEQRGFGFMGLGQIWGPRFSNIALTYDLCHDAWSDSFRAEVRRYLLNGSAATGANMQKFSTMANQHPCSNFYSPIVGGGSMLALAYWMHPGSPPMAPGGMELLVPSRLSGTPETGVPVVPLVSAEPPPQWIWSGLATGAVSPNDLLNALGDTRAEPIRDGRAFTFGARTFSFHAVPSSCTIGGSISPWATLAEQDPEAPGAAMLLYTIVENHRPGYYSVHLPIQGESRLYINDLVLPSGSYVQLDEGLYPLLLAYEGNKDMVSGIGAVFRFVTSSRKEIDVLLAEGAAKLKEKQVLHELAMA